MDLKEHRGECAVRYRGRDRACDRECDNDDEGLSALVVKYINHATLTLRTSQSFPTKGKLASNVDYSTGDEIARRARGVI